MPRTLSLGDKLAAINRLREALRVIDEINDEDIVRIPDSINSAREAAKAVTAGDIEVTTRMHYESEGRVKDICTRVELEVILFQQANPDDDQKSKHADAAKKLFSQWLEASADAGRICALREIVMDAYHKRLAFA